MKKRTWRDVDWVYLGMLGCDIDESGAGFNEERLDMNEFAHLDLKTLEIMGNGSPRFWEIRLAELRVAGVFGPTWALTSTNATGVTYGCHTTHIRLIA